ncbi:hypothetical protein [Mucilaginibacter myungsuensis]|uniref:Uncharacterized protein n=1 Tax=Mucilaginibacter myungsuensis TaxID=649104 RepID=A0A929KXP6_9SPHI|nr:hypothetical protein [Mucilaginibacter myungsuensis]MBE9662567.1 hypothetical protein [Mucilaginibacter myungsuensis]MDN3597987.1 hypothetical protein [Mucilaginibacter myungsuensis]
MEKVYHLGKGRLVFISLFLMFALITAGRGFYLYKTLNDPMWILPGIVPLVIACIVFPLLLTTKLTITTWSITRIGLLGTKEMLISDIAGYRLRHIPRTRRMMLVFVSRNGDTMNVRYFQLDEGDEILRWAEERFARLD